MFLKAFRQRIQDDSITLVISLMTFATCWVLMARKGREFGIEIADANVIIFILGGFILLAFDFMAFLALKRPDRPISALYKRYLSPEGLGRTAASLPLLAALAVFMPYFSAMKSLIPIFHPFNWDDTFVRWDREILGTDAWRLLQPALGFPLVTSAISITYQTWLLLVNFGCLILCFYATDRRTRSQFFSSYMACWAFIGLFMATMLASVGPCFLEPILGDNRFAEQMAYLKAANQHYPVTSLAIQDLLLNRYRHNASGLGSGISAMPSMHISVAMLYWLTVRRLSRPAGFVFFAFLMVIFVGSIHLAYHYAVDGIVAMAVTGIIWLAIGRLLDRLIPPQRP